jgi:peptide-methionine (S)-S-oxide reductase
MTLKAIVMHIKLGGLILGLILTSLSATWSSMVFAQEDHEGPATAIFAGGCFWCVEADFDKVAGVLTTTSGYIGGHVDNPTYKQVSRGGTGHFEAVQITFDPAAVSYEDLLYVFWRSVDPTDAGGQFCDRGQSYETAIFTTTEEQRQEAETSKSDIEEQGLLRRPIVTQIQDAPEFFAAEDYHQDYYKKNPVRYKYYRHSCGRKKQIKRVWGDEAWLGP